MTFADTYLGARRDLTLVIGNGDVATLVLEGRPRVEIAGTDLLDFLIVGQVDSVIAPSENMSVTVRFDPLSAGAKSAVLSIDSNDPDEPVCQVALSGTALGASAPDIDVAPASHAFSGTFVGEADDLTLTIANAGNAVLTLSDVPPVEIQGTDAGEFAVLAQPGPTIAAGGHVALTVRFAPASPGAKSATLRVASDDPDEAIVEVPLSGAAATLPTSLLPLPLGCAAGGGTRAPAAPSCAIALCVLCFVRRAAGCRR
jgi:hypothetical protein